MKDAGVTKAFTLVEIMIVMAVIGIIAAIAIPNYLKSKAMTDKNACISNMAHIRDAEDMWALENNIAAGVTPQTSDLTPNFIRTCPTCLNSSYAAPAVGNNPVCPNGISGHVLTSGTGGGGGATPPPASPSE